MANEQKEIQVQVGVPEHLKAGNYTNLFSATTTSGGEVIIDFVFTHPQDKANDGKQLGTLVSRVIMPIKLAIALKLALESQLGKHKKE